MPRCSPRPFRPGNAGPSALAQAGRRRWMIYLCPVSYPPSPLARRLEQPLRRGAPTGRIRHLADRAQVCKCVVRPLRRMPATPTERRTTPMPTIRAQQQVLPLTRCVSRKRLPNARIAACRQERPPDGQGLGGWASVAGRALRGKFCPSEEQIGKSIPRGGNGLALADPSPVEGVRFSSPGWRCR